MDQRHITKNRAEHATLREQWGLVLPHSRSDKAVRGTHENGYSTAE
ncbi:hypothetical protein AB0904_07805 [Streptomyces sp. NPDC006684]